MSTDGATPTTAYPAERIRDHPGTYVGNTGVEGLQNMLFYVVLNSLSEVASGDGHAVKVRLCVDGSVEITDDGCGIASNSNLIVSNLEIALAEIRKAAPPITWATDIAYTIANALSEWLEIEIWQDNQIYQQEFSCGKPVAAPTVTVSESSSESGLRLTFKPHPAIFGEAQFSADVIRDRLQTYAFLNSNVELSLVDDATGSEDSFDFADGIRDYVHWLNQDRQPLHPEILVRGEQSGVRYQIGLQWCEEEDQLFHGYMNNERAGRGSHQRGLQTAVHRSLNETIKNAGLRNGRELDRHDTTRGLTAVVAVGMANPHYDSSTRSSLNSRVAERVVYVAIRRYLRQYFRTRPALVERIGRLAIESQSARDRASSNRRRRSDESGS